MLLDTPEGPSFLYALIITCVTMLILSIYRNKTRPAVTEFNIQALNKRILEFKPDHIINRNYAEILKHRILETKTPDESDLTCINLAKANYLDFLNNDTIKRKAEDCIRMYGVGSCGPRGFYGTVDVHLNVENRIANFMNMEETVLYSYGFSTISSAVGAYCKRSDIVFCDEHICFATQQGLVAAKSKVIYFKHNDVSDLEVKLKEYEERENRKNTLFRKFLIVEGIYGKTGTICPLPELVALCRKYKLRMFLDESLSFGILGETGRGVTEHYKINRSEIDMIMGSLEGSLGSIGGFCVGASVVIEHQRLSGLGYCFSASLPPFLSYITIAAIDLFEDNPQIFKELALISKIMDEKLKAIPELEILSDPLSPMKVVEMKNKSSIIEVHEFCTEINLYLIKEENRLKMNLNVKLTEEQIDRIAEILSDACKSVA